MSEPMAHDVFISYSRKDIALARLFEHELEKYSPPKGLALPNGAAPQHLRIFRDQSDLTGVEYHQSIARHLRESRKLLVLCSPRSRASPFVDDEIRTFVAAHGAEHVVPLIIDGLPNNEASAEQDAIKAFPTALCEAMQMPLAGDYRGFDARKDKLNKGTYYGAWYTLLANVLDVSRSDIEQRDQKRAARRRTITIVMVAGVITLLSVAFVVTLFSQREAVQQRDQAEHRRLVALTQLVAIRAVEQTTENPTWAPLIARQAYLFNERVDHEVQAEVDAALRATLNQAPVTREVRAERPFHASAVSTDLKLLATSGNAGLITLWSLADNEPAPTRLRDLTGHTIDVVSLAFSRDGNMLASASWDQTVRQWNLSSPESAPQIWRGHTGYVQAVAFSPDGRWLASASNDGTVRVWDAVELRADPAVLRVPDGAVLSVAFSTDGRRLIAGTSTGSVVLWDAANLTAPPRIMSTPGERVTSVTTSRDHRMLAASIDYKVFLWDLVNPAAERRTLSRDFRVTGVAFSPDGTTLAVGQSYGGERWASVEVWQLARLDVPPIVFARPASVDAFAYGTQSLTAVGRGDGVNDWYVTLQTWQLPTQALADKVCAKARANIPALLWEQVVGSDVPYERTCARHTVHPDVFVRAENLAREGRLEHALALLKHADELDHPDKPPPDRAVEFGAYAAGGLIARGEAMARHGDMAGAIEALRNARALDPKQKFDPVARARAARASQLVRAAEQRAQEGDYDAALALYSEVRRLDPALVSDPKQFASKRAASGLVRKAIDLSHGDAKLAVAAVRRALELDPGVSMSLESWNALCWNGSLSGYAADVMFACDRAAADEEPLNGIDSRGVARALVGDLAGALEDLKAVVDADQYGDDAIAQRKSWIAALERGENPFTPQVLAALKNAQ